MHALQFYNRHITLESRVQQTGWHRNCIRKCKTLTTQFTFASISNHVNKPFHISLICFSLWLTLTHTHTLCHHYSFVHCRTNAFCFAKETPQNFISSKIKAQKSKRHAQINRRQVMMMVLMMTIFILRMQIKIINNYTKIEMNSLSRICQAHIVVCMCVRDEMRTGYGERDLKKCKCDRSFLFKKLWDFFHFNSLLCIFVASVTVVVVVSVVVVVFNNAVATAVSVAVNRPCWWAIFISSFSALEYLSLCLARSAGIRFASFARTHTEICFRIAFEWMGNNNNNNHHNTTAAAAAANKPRTIQIGK